MKTAREIIAETLERDWNLQGDACNEPRADAILASLAAEGFSIVETGRDPVTIEACAKVADGWLESSWIDEVFAARSIADAIRSLSRSTREGKTP